MKVPLTLVLFFALIGGSYAQTAHKTGLPSCKYYKRPPGKGAMGIEPGAFCPACREKDKKEQEAKRAEDKRRAEVLAAENQRKAKEEAERIKRKQEQNKSTEVVIAAPKETKTPAGTSNTETKPATKYEEGYLYNIRSQYNRSLNGLFGYSGYRYNGFIVNGDTILNHNEFENCVGANFENPYNFPPNIGIVLLKQRKTSRFISGGTFLEDGPIVDLVDINGNRLLKDDNISVIFHLVDDYFVIGKGRYYDNNYLSRFCILEEVEILNYKTKETYPLQKMKEGGVSVSKSADDSYYSWDEKDLIRPKGNYKAYIMSEIANNEFMIYYITLDGKIEQDHKISKN